MSRWLRALSPIVTWLTVALLACPEQSRRGLPQVLVETTDGSSTVYLYGHDGSASLTTGLLGEDTAWAWHLGDGPSTTLRTSLGSPALSKVEGVRQLADGSGDACPERSRRITLAQGYTPFGVLLWREGSGASGFGYTGEREDAYTQFIYLRARWMDPASGRFISPDTIIPDFAYPQSLNRFSYVLGNPLCYVDPTGHFTEEEIMRYFGGGNVG